MSLIERLYKKIAASRCPDALGCTPLAVRPTVEGFLCVGKLAKPTDHILRGVNDKCLCFRQGAKHDRWHVNRNDILVFFDLLTAAMIEEDRLEEPNAVHKAGAARRHRTGNT